MTESKLLTHGAAQSYAAKIEANLNRSDKDGGVDRYRATVGISITNQEERYHVHVTDIFEREAPISIGSYTQAEKMLRG